MPILRSARMIRNRENDDASVIGAVHDSKWKTFDEYTARILRSR